MDDHVIGAFILTLAAGLATGIGGLVVFFSNIKNNRFLALSTSFAAGVMIYVSFVEMLPEAQISFERYLWFKLWRIHFSLFVFYRYVTCLPIG